MDRVLIVARMNESDMDAVTDVWAESDATELPALVGVRRRSLFHFHGLYFHLIESEQTAGTEAQIEAMRAHPLFQDVNTKLEKYITAYDERTWRGPKDAMANRFYSWQASR